MNKIVTLLIFICTLGFAHNSYTGGYSGSPGKLSCASSCHGGTGGTITVAGFPTSYEPSKKYTITIKHVGGSPIVNFNATTRIGATTSIAGIFAAKTNCTLYTGTDGGVYASPHSIDSAVFEWTAPSGGSGVVNFYISGFQGTTNGTNGQSKSLVLTSSELTDVKSNSNQIEKMELFQNYPNPFNPSTTIVYQLPVNCFVTLKIFDVLGKEIVVLMNEKQTIGIHNVTWNPISTEGGLPSGIYYYRLEVSESNPLQTEKYTEMKKMIFIK